MTVSPIASVGASVKGHSRANCSPLPDKRMLWAGMTGCVHLLTAVFFFHPSIQLYEENGVLILSRRILRLPMSFNPVGDRRLQAQERRQGVVLGSLLCYLLLFYTRHTLLLSSILMTCSPNSFHRLHISFVIHLFSLPAPLTLDCLILSVCSCVLLSSDVCPCMHTLTPTSYIHNSYDWCNVILSLKVQHAWARGSLEMVVHVAGGPSPSEREESHPANDSQFLAGGTV